MTDINKNAVARILILLGAVLLSLVMLFAIWSNFNPEKTIPWLNFFVTMLGFAIAYLSIPDISKMSTTSCRDWLLVIMSLMIAIFSFALYGLSIDWLTNLSLWGLGLLLIGFLIVLFLIYLIFRRPNSSVIYRSKG